ncbi:transcription initiation factor TFIID subunit 6 isoform X1 [Onthophagus taurus]|uniref:transcription initiation factor TFIID subunit 6 isoform X1 n=1 Tax=Onthophagus taurus TaxID=166361 RepID=UPI0039BE6434
MAKNTDSDLYGTSFSAESIKVVAESIGIPNLPDDAAKELADDISYRLKHIIQDAAKFMHHAKRTKLMNTDVDYALKIKNAEPQYGFHMKETLPFRFASGGGRELHFVEEKEVDLNELLQNVSPKAPLDVTLRAHWLCIDGVQPTIPENPPPVSKQLQKLESVDPIKINKPTKEAASKPSTGKHKLRNVETVQIKQLATHELSVEQQLYYKEITEACVGADEGRRAEALQSLASDPGLHEMLPRMCTFIIEGVRVNVVQKNLALLIYLMRMVKALLDNQSLFLEKYLHELIPSVTTCIVSRQLCQRPELDNHWALRDFASRLMAQICKNFNTSTNNIQTRVTRLFSNALQQGENLALASLYGALEGLSELGPEVIKTFIFPRIKTIGTTIEQHLEGPLMSSQVEKVACGHIKQLLAKVLAPIIKNIRNPPDYLDDYKIEYGYLGQTLQNAVMKARTQPPATTTTTTNMTNNAITSVGANISRAVPTPTGLGQQQNSNQGRTIVMNQGNRVTTSSGNQKIVFLAQQRPQTPGGMLQQQNQQNVQNQQNTIVKFVSNANTQNSQKVVNTQQKLVVVCMPSSTPNTAAPISTQSTGNLLSPDPIMSNQSPLSVVQKQPSFLQQQGKIKMEPMHIDLDLS